MNEVLILKREAERSGWSLIRKSDEQFDFCMNPMGSRFVRAPGGQGRRALDYKNQEIIFTEPSHWPDLLHEMAHLAWHRPPDIGSRGDFRFLGWELRRVLAFDFSINIWRRYWGFLTLDGLFDAMGEEERNQHFATRAARQTKLSELTEIQWWTVMHAELAFEFGRSPEGVRLDRQLDA